MKRSTPARRSTGTDVHRPWSQSVGGWTALELAVVIAIVAALIVAGVPALQEYLAKAKTREGIENVERLVRGSALYVSTPSVDNNGLAVVCRFPNSAPATPAATCCKAGGSRCVGAPGDWQLPTWKALGFSLTDEHRFVYRYESQGTGSQARFKASAIGDLDCDGRQSSIARRGEAVTSRGDEAACSLRLAPGFEIVDRFE